MIKSAKKWVIGLFCMCGMVLALGAGIVAAVDPYFHYHKPLPFLQYQISDQRYQNDGIVKHFDYNAIITGSSMTDNFKTTEFDSLFGTQAIKVPFRGATFKETNENLKTAFAHKKDIKVVLRCLDYDHLFDTADAMAYDEATYPWYLYDDKLYNDAAYLFNKTVLFDMAAGTVISTIQGAQTTSFDQYSSWGEQFQFGKEALDAQYDRTYRLDTETLMTETDYQNLKENIAKNVIALAEENPQTDFYVFFPPYSIYYWDILNQNRTLIRQFDAEKYCIELLLPYENIHIFSFTDAYEITCDLNNYRDVFHYGADVNSKMLQWMAEGEHEITKENYVSYCKRVREFYLNYNYDGLFQ